MKAFVVVNRARFRMNVYLFDKSDRAWNVNEFEITTGVVGHHTRQGEYTVRSKSLTPDWLAPEWAKGVGNLNGEDVAIAGNVWPIDNPVNPFEGGFISFEDNDPDNDNEGQGFHGTKFDPMVGTRASHGCVRMRTADFLRIYDWLTVGTPVIII